jgi:hypothetical protein
MICSFGFFSLMMVIQSILHPKHPPTPFKGGFTTIAIPPLKGVGGCFGWL